MSNSLTIYVNRGEFVWESDIWRGSDKIGSCTGPTLAGCMDTAYEIIAEHDPEWANFDSNEDSRKRHMYQAKHSKNAEIVEAPVVMSNKMTHDELLAKITYLYQYEFGRYEKPVDIMTKALRAVVELHKPIMAFTGAYDGEENELWAEQCQECSGNGFSQMYPCPTIEAIEKELS